MHVEDMAKEDPADEEKKEEPLHPTQEAHNQKKCAEIDTLLKELEESKTRCE